jgi:hypothetical protein
MSRRPLTITTPHCLRLEAQGQSIAVEAMDDGSGGVGLRIGEPFDVVFKQPLRRGSKIKYTMSKAEHTHIGTERRGP